MAGHSARCSWFSQDTRLHDRGDRHAALAIGANTAIFGLLNALLLREYIVDRGLLQDPVTLVVAPALLFSIAALACLLPALRAGRTDPMITLRAE